MLSLQQVSATDSDHEIKLHSMLDEFGDVPQALFELSLRDLVELPQIIASAMQEKQSKEREFTERKSRSWEGRKKAVKKRRPRSQSMDIGVGLLKWIIPLSSRNKSADSSRSISKKLAGCFFLDSRKQNLSQKE